MLYSGRFFFDKNTQEVMYEGRMPDLKPNQELAVGMLTFSDLEMILRQELLLLLTTKSKMDKSLYSINKSKRKKIRSEILLDEILYEAKDTTQHKLFLDRHIYSFNPKDSIFIRYVSVDQSIMEEGY